MNTKKTKVSSTKIAAFLGKVYAHNNSLKLYHWSVTGAGSYERHIALDQALESLSEILDRLVETSIALHGDLQIIIPETKAPKDIVKHCEAFYSEVEKSRGLFAEAFTQAIVDDYHETLQQLLYRMTRLR